LKEIVDQLNQEVSSQIPEEIKTKLNSTVVRRNMLQQYGKKSFLIPDELKYPVVNPNTGEYECTLIYAAYVRAAQFGKDSVKSKAKSLFDSCKCEDKLNIHVENEVIGTVDFLDLYEDITCDETEFKNLVGE
jgi:hypothetical protein